MRAPSHVRGRAQACQLSGVILYDININTLVPSCMHGAGVYTDHPGDCELALQTAVQTCGVAQHTAQCHGAQNRPCQHDSFIPHLTYPAPLEPGSQAVVGLTSTAMGDLAGISGDESFCIHPLHCRSSYVATVVPSPPLHSSPVSMYTCMPTYTHVWHLSITSPLSNTLKNKHMNIYIHLPPPLSDTHVYTSVRI